MIDIEGSDIAYQNMIQEIFSILDLTKIRDIGVGTIRYKKGLRQKVLAERNTDLFFNEFTGNQNSPVAFQMLEGLQDGTNYTWTLSFQRKLTSYLDINLNYLGRKSPTSKVIHTGTLQLRASF